VVHIDFKSPNIMMQSLVPTVPIVAKIADFGTSRNFFGIPMYGRFVDNPVWLAPEVLSGQPYDMRVDTYAYGVILWEILSRRNFFGEDSFNFAIEDKILKGLRPPIGTCPTIYKELIESCWTGNRDERPSMSVVLEKLEILKKTENFSVYQSYEKQQYELLVKERELKDKQEKLRQEEEEKQKRLLLQQKEDEKRKQLEQEDWEAVLNVVEKPEVALKLFKLPKKPTTPGSGTHSDDEEDKEKLQEEEGIDGGKLIPKIKRQHLRKQSKDDNHSA